MTTGVITVFIYYTTNRWVAKVSLVLVLGRIFGVHTWMHIYGLATTIEILTVAGILA
jgi:hypothetical protein